MAAIFWCKLAVSIIQLPYLELPYVVPSYRADAATSRWRWMSRFFFRSNCPRGQQTPYPVDDRGRLVLLLGLQDDCFIFDGQDKCYERGVRILILETGLRL